MGLALPLAELTERERRRFSGFALSETGIYDRRIAAVLEVSPSTVTSWVKRFAGEPRIWDAPRNGRPRLYGKDVEERFIGFYCQSAPLERCGRGRWSLRTAARELMERGDPISSLSRSTMQRMLSRHALKPHLTRYFLQITDPNFFPKMERLIDLYLSGAEYLFCFDECPGIQVLKRLAPDAGPLETDASRWLNEFEYIRNGTLDVFAFLEVKTGKVKAECHRDHTKATFLKVFRRHADSLPSNVRIDYVMDNLDSHCCQEFCAAVAELSGVESPPSNLMASRESRREWLGRKDKRVVIHFTPLHGSWLNMVEIWFRIMGRMCLRDSYDGPEQLRDAIMEFADKWSERWANPFKWNYRGEGLHRKAVLRFIGMLTNASEEITLQLLTKESLLMVNLMNDYSDKAEPKIWRQLFEAVGHVEENLRKGIERSEQPIVKKKAADALRLLLSTMAEKTGLKELSVA